MALEIERKYLVNPLVFRHFKAIHSLDYVAITQGYLNIDSKVTTRIRLVNKPNTDDSKAIGTAYLTLKTKTGDSLSRNEYEYEIPYKDGLDILQECNTNIIHKLRYSLPWNSELTWEVDEFIGKLKGLWVAEIEVPSVNTEIKLPAFILEEVSGNSKFKNKRLSIEQKVPKLARKLMERMCN